MTAATIARLPSASRCTSFCMFRSFRHRALGIIVGAMAGIRQERLDQGDGRRLHQLIKMVIAPIIFCTVVSGISHIQGGQEGRPRRRSRPWSFRGRLDLRPGVGLSSAISSQPGRIRNGAAANADAVKQYTGKAQSSVDFVMGIIPIRWSARSPRATCCRYCCSRSCSAFSLMALGERGHTVRALVDDMAHAVFGVIAIVMKVALIGAFGAMAYTIGRWPRLDGQPAEPDRHLLRDRAAVRARRARDHRAHSRLQHLQVPRLHQGRAADRARHVLVGIGAADPDGEAGASGLLEVGRRSSSFRPAIRSTSTAPTST